MPKILNNLICSAMIFALSFLWIYFCLKSVAWAVTLGLTLALCSAYLIYRAQTKAGQLRSVKQQNKKAVNGLYEYLKYNENNAELFAELYRYYGYETETIDGDEFAASKDGQTAYVTTLFYKNNVSDEDLCRLVLRAKRRKADKLKVFANKVDSAALANAKRHFDVETVDVNNAYELLKAADKLPVVPDVKPIKRSFVASYAFNRKRFAWYFASSVFTALISLIAYFPYYLLAWSTALLGLALYSMFNTRYNVKHTCVKLD